jgi:hypothetical protein
MLLPETRLTVFHAAVGVCEGVFIPDIACPHATTHEVVLSYYRQETAERR